MNSVASLIAHAESLDRKAEATGDPMDFMVASAAYGRAANASHVIGTDWDKPKDERQKAFDLGVNLNKLSDDRKRRAEAIRSAKYQARREHWSARETLVGGKPPPILNVLDEHGGFTAITKPSFADWDPVLGRRRAARTPSRFSKPTTTSRRLSTRCPATDIRSPYGSTTGPERGLRNGSPR